MDHTSAYFNGGPIVKHAIYRHRQRALFVAGTALAIVASGVAAIPANAATRTFSDAHADVGNGMDIHSVRVANGARYLSVTTRHRSLQTGEIEIYVDTLASSPGPEFALFSIVKRDGDWMVVKLRRNWGSGTGPRDCNSNVRWSDWANTFTATLARACIGYAGRVRISVRVLPSRGRIDWAPGYRRFTPWVAKG